MSHQARKIWCPKCHKRHRLPANADGLTLRCRGCKFAFRAEDGLAQDPAEDVQPVAVPAGFAESEQHASTERSPSESSSTAIPVQGESMRSSNHEPIGLEHDFDDILDVLETPNADAEPIGPPPRAHARQPETATVPRSVRTTPVSDPTETETLRQPVTRQQLRAHKNSRQFWMLVSFLFACLLGTFSWFAVGMFMDPTLSNWERKMLYAMGAPARLLPQQEEGAEALLPADHVKLRGDHVELADRDDVFRDDFFEHAMCFQRLSQNLDREMLAQTTTHKTTVGIAVKSTESRSKMICVTASRTHRHRLRPTQRRR